MSAKVNTCAECGTAISKRATKCRVHALRDAKARWNEQYKKLTGAYEKGKEMRRNAR